MKPDWDELGDEFDNSKKVLIGDVDCTVEQNKPLCEREGVQGYPTLKIYRDGERGGEVYNGERDLKTLKAVAKSLGPSCGPKTLSRCSETEAAAVKGYMEMAPDDLNAEVERLETIMKEANDQNQELLKALQAQYKESEDKRNALFAEHTPVVKLMKSVLRQASPPAVDADAAKAEL
jgi:hypothetical protein